MSKRYGKGWSSVRGRATHDYDAAAEPAWSDLGGVWWVWRNALCGSPIRVLASELAQVVMRLKKLEACRHCQRERRLRPSGKRARR